MKEKFTPGSFGEFETELHRRLLELERDLIAEAMRAPFGTTDSLAITTAGGTVNVAAPPSITLVDDPTNGLQIQSIGTAQTVRLLAFGYDANDNRFGVLCRFPFSNPARISHASFVAAIRTAGGGAFPGTVMAGISNQGDVNGWDDVARVGEAERWFQLGGAQLNLMGELQ